MLYIDPYREKPLKIFLFEIRKSMSFTFGTQLCLVDLCQESYSPGAENGPAQGPTCFTWTYEGKTFEIFLFETRRPSSLIFGTQLCLVDLYQDFSNYSPWVKIGPALGVTCYT